MVLNLFLLSMIIWKEEIKSLLKEFVGSWSFQVCSFVYNALVEKVHVKKFWINAGKS